MAPIAPSLETAEVKAQARNIFDAQRQAIYCRTDRLFALLMVLQWAGAILAACLLSPRTWAGTVSAVHPHVWAAIFLGGLLSIFPVSLALASPGRVLTRQVIAVSQLLMSALLIHITGGRAETHFHIFGSLAFLAFYRDWRVLATATVVTATDHLLRGIYWPQSVYGFAVASPWLTLEHVGWVAFEDAFLLISCRQSLQEMHQISLRQAQLEVAEEILLRSHETLETRVTQRTQALAQVQRQNELLLNSAGEGIYGIDREGVGVFANPATSRMLGYEVAELIGQPMHSLLHHSHRDGSGYPVSDCPIYHCLHHGEAHHVDDEVFWRKDGTCFDVEYHSTPLWEEGRIVGAVITFQDITERRRSTEAVRKSEERLRTVVENAPVIFSSFDENGVYTLSEGSCLELLGLKPGEAVGQSVFDLYADNPQIIGNTRRVLGGEAIHSITQIGELMFDVYQSPIRDSQGKTVGSIGVSTNITQQFRAEQEIYQLHADLTAAYDETLNAYDATIEGLSRALDYRDRETRGHSERVTQMALRMGQALGLTSDALTQIRRGALLHDIGKMAVPDSILHKPGPLTPEERAVMCRHTEYAREMLWPIVFLRPALDIPCYHHEKWDGTGYPQGLKGEEIPLAARLFALIDVWDALSSDRPYRLAWPPERVLDHLHSLTGTHFDPALVPVFLGLLEQAPQLLAALPERRRAA